MEVLRVLALGSVKEEGDEPAVRWTIKTHQWRFNSRPQLFSGGPKAPNEHGNKVQRRNLNLRKARKFPSDLDDNKVG